MTNAPLPADLCAREPELKRYGFYRRLDNGKLEFISFCTSNVSDWIGVYGPEFYKFLDALLPEPPVQPEG